MAVGASTSPIVVAGTAYVQDEAGTVYAIDVSSGRVKWKTKALGFSIGPYGVSVGWGKLFASTPNGVAAFTLSDGAPLWNRRITTTPGQGVDIQTLPYGGKVYVATVPVAIGNFYTGGSVGYLEALDANSGKVAWRFDTVKSRDLWGNPAVNSGGGAWYPPAIDARTGVLYWGVANPAPFVGTTRYPNGSSRPGANLYTDSMVALSARTGGLLWYHQAFPHDLYDRDEVHAMLVPVGRSVTGPVSSRSVRAREATYSGSIPRPAGSCGERRWGSTNRGTCHSSPDRPRSCRERTAVYSHRLPQQATWSMRLR